MASISDSGIKDIILKEDLTIKEVKELVKRKFKFAPSLNASLIINGKTLDNDETHWAQVAAIPMKTIIRVIGTR